MKRKHYKLWLVFTLALVNGFFAAAQSNTVASPTDYASFSRFITERNIFDPNRYPRNVHDSRPHTSVRQTRTQRAAPAFTLVGTMSYEKGMFAFFDGNNADLRKVLPASGNIAGYTVAEVTLAGVELQSADKKETVKMKIGEMMRQDGDHWKSAGTGDLDRSSGTESDPGTTSEAPAPNSGSTPEAPTAAGPANDVLKRLMQQREQELK
jgi:hypothetical protein